MVPKASPGREALDVKHFKPQALAALCKAAEQQSQELTLPPALPVHLRPPPPPPGDPPWKRTPSTLSVPVRARLSPMPAISPWSPAPFQCTHSRPLEDISASAPTVPQGRTAAPAPPSRTASVDTSGGDTAALRLFVGTWNMHGKEPPASLRPWLPVSPDEHDMYVIGTQEAERSIERSLIISSKAKWEAALRAHLGDGFVLLSVQSPRATFHLALRIHASPCQHTPATACQAC